MSCWHWHIADQRFSGNQIRIIEVPDNRGSTVYANEKYFSSIKPLVFKTIYKVTKI